MNGMTKIESFLMDLNISYTEITPFTFYVDDPEHGIVGTTIMLNEPIVVIRTDVMKLPKTRQGELYEHLLRLNGTDLVHGAYGLDGDDVVLLDTLEYLTMDKGEFEASLDSISLALSKHYAILGKFRN